MGCVGGLGRSSGLDAVETVQLTVRRVPFTQVRERLRLTFGNDEAAIAAEVAEGGAHCWEIGQAAMITRREGAELVIMCLAGKGLKAIAPAICEAAKRAGCGTIRFHTQRPGLYRLLQHVGAELREYVFEIKV